MSNLPVIDIDKYEWPKGIDPDQPEIQQKVALYGLLDANNETWVVVKSSKDELYSYRFEKVSNFRAEIILHMEDERNPMKLVKIINNRGRERIFEVEASATSTLQRFTDAIELKGNYFWEGEPRHFQRLKKCMFENMQDGRLIEVLGWQQEGFFAFCNALVLPSGEVARPSKYGTIDVNGISYYIPAANAIYKHNKKKFINEKRVQFLQSKIDFATWAVQMKRVHRQHAITSILFGIAASLSDHIFSSHTPSFFPMMFYYGEQSTGKGNLITAIQHLWGIPQNPITITGKANTDKAKIRKFAQFVNMMVFMEEYRNAIGPEAIEMLKGLYNRYGYERGTIDSGYGTEAVPISSAVAITGNDYPTNLPLLSRLTIEEMTKEKFSKEDVEEYRKLEKMMGAGYSSILLEIIQWRTEFEEEYRQKFDAAKDEIHDVVGDIPGVTTRHEDSLAVFLAVFDFFDKKLKFPWSREAVIDHFQAITQRQCDRQQNENESTKFWDAIMGAHNAGMVRQGYEYDIQGKELYISIARCYAGYSEHHFRIYREHPTAKQTLTDRLKKSAPFLRKKNSHRFGETFSSNAMVFDLTKLPESLQSLLSGMSKSDD